MASQHGQRPARRARTATGPGGRSPLQLWAADKPHQAAIQVAQQRLRAERPELQASARTIAQATGLLRRMLTASGCPARQAFVIEHENPGRGASQVVTINRQMGVALHPRRWDVGTVAHEAAHIVHIHHAGWNPLASQRDERRHGPDFARHYAAALNVASPGAGASFLRHYEDAVATVGNYRRTVLKLPRDFAGSGLTADPGPPRSRLADKPALPRRAVWVPERARGRPQRSRQATDGRPEPGRGLELEQE